MYFVDGAIDGVDMGSVVIIYGDADPTARETNRRGNDIGRDGTARRPARANDDDDGIARANDDDDGDDGRDGVRGSRVAVGGRRRDVGRRDDGDDG